MKLFAFFFLPLFLLAGSPSYSQNLDQISDTTSVLNLIEEQLPKYEITYRKPRHYYTYLPQLDSIYSYFYDSLDIQPFYQVDLTGNGRADLIINAFWRRTTALLIVLDKGAGNIIFHPLLSYFSRNRNIFFIKPDYSMKPPSLSYYLVDINSLLDSIRPRFLHNQFKNGFLEKKTLVYRFGQFLELNPSPKPLSFDEIKYERGGFFDGATAYQMRISKSGSVSLALYRNPNQNPTISGTGLYTSQLTPDILARFKELSGYIDVSKLKQAYEVEETHPPYGILKVRHGADSVIINDRGLSGTFGLAALHNYFDTLYRNLNWKKSDAETFAENPLL